jgi:hypothetical protein
MNIRGNTMPSLSAFGVNRLTVRIAAGLTSAALALVVTGCGTGSAPIPQDVSNVVLTGMVHGGQQPVTGAHIALFATTSAGYNGTLTPLAAATTNSSGNFTISTAYTCPATQQAYIVSTGGNPGLTGTVDNSAIFLVAALGPCSGINSSTSIDINEVTTVAAAYALNGFAPSGGTGLTESAVVAGTNVPGITTSSTNTQGLTDAFANANNIVNFSTGTAYTATPTTAANGTVPQGTINALADILQDCVNSSTSGSTACTTLFSAATPPSGSGVSAPANVFQAALDIAKYPGNNVSTLFGLISANAAFPTTLALPNDWTVGIAYTNSNLVSGSGLGINAQDHVYVSGAGYLINFTAQGAPISSTNLVPTLTATDTLRQIAFDKSGNLFVTDGAYTGVYEYSSGGTLTGLNFDGAPALEANNNTYGVAVDGLGDVWTSSYSKSTCSTVTCPLIEFPSNANVTPAYPAYTPFSTFGGFNAPQPTNAVGGSRDIAFDVKTGNVWVTAIDDNSVEFFNVTPSAAGAANATAAPTTIALPGTEVAAPTSKTGCGSIAVAIDSTSHAWITEMGGTASNCGAVINPGVYQVSSTGLAGTSVTGGGLNTPTAVKIDGNNNLFIANTGASSIVEYSQTLPGFVSPSTTGFIPSSTGTLYQPSYLAIDRSGAVWALSSGNGTSHPANLLQILGAAAPTDPVQADGNYGVKP